MERWTNPDLPLEDPEVRGARIELRRTIARFDTTKFASPYDISIHGPVDPRGDEEVNYREDRAYHLPIGMGIMNAQLLRPVGRLESATISARLFRFHTGEKALRWFETDYYGVEDDQLVIGSSGAPFRRFAESAPSRPALVDGDPMKSQFPIVLPAAKPGGTIPYEAAITDRLVNGRALDSRVETVSLHPHPQAALERVLGLLEYVQVFGVPIQPGFRG